MKLKYKKGPNSDPTGEKKKKASKRKQTKFFNGTFKKFIKKQMLPETTTIWTPMTI